MNRSKSVLIEKFLRQAIVATAALAAVAICAAATAIAPTGDALASARRAAPATFATDDPRVGDLGSMTVVAARRPAHGG